jgi:23S rRNA pseudouridine1911/1915/1917 synthase
MEETPKNTAPNRLDKYLTAKFPQYSRAFLKSQINTGNVLVNGKIVKPSYILKEKDKVKINIVKKAPAVLKPNHNIKLEIIYEDKNIIAINKPAGIAVHPAQPECRDTIVNALLAYYPLIKDVGDMPEFRPGIVHRLDKDTSGIMVVAKNQKTFDWLKKQFAERKIEKKYIALVYGKIKEEKGIISKPIGKTKDFRKRTTISLKTQKEAITYFRVLKHIYLSPSVEGEIKRGCCSKSTPLRPKEHLPSSDGREGREGEGKTKQHLPPTPSSTEEGGENFYYTLIEAEPKTGRTHQIRVHLASVGHPIVGDALYGFKNQTLPQGLQRHFLHASSLKFSLFDGKIIELKSELPEDLKKILQSLKLN